jgi:hypothetical protein
MEYRSPAFSSFRELMNTWDEAVEKEKIQSLLGNNNLIFFFEKGGEIFGSPEGGRVVYAKMKNKDEDKEWTKEATFMAVNLSKAMDGEVTRRIFSHEDLKGIKVIDQDIAEKKLAKKGSAEKIKVDLDQEPQDAQPDAAPNIDKISEK